MGERTPEPAQEGNETYESCRKGDRRVKDQKEHFIFNFPDTINAISKMSKRDRKVAIMTVKELLNMAVENGKRLQRIENMRKEICESLQDADNTFSSIK